MNKLLAFAMDLLNIVSWEEAPKATIGEAALYALVGFSVVFLGISFLIFVLWAVGRVMTFLEKKKAEPKEAAKVETTAEQASASENGEEISEETIAVITAAIMAYYVKENRKCEFTVKRIKRI